MKNTNNTASSRTFEQVAGLCLSTIGDIKALNLNLAKVEDKARELGLPEQGNEESCSAWLFRVAASATEQKHDALKREALEDIASEVEHNSTRRRSVVGRFFDRAARAADSFSR